MPGKPGSSTMAASPGSSSNSRDQPQALADARRDDHVVRRAGDSARLSEIGGDRAPERGRTPQVLPFGGTVAPLGLEQARPDGVREGVQGRPAEGEGVGHVGLGHEASPRAADEPGARAATGSAPASGPADRGLAEGDVASSGSDAATRVDEPGRAVR